MAKRLSKPPQKQSFSPQSGLGFACGLGIEFMSGILAGFFLGYIIDRVWGVQPWGLVTMVVLGSSAGLLNIFRMLRLWGNPAAKSPPSGRGEEKDG